MDKIAIIGANEFQLPLILEAREKGIETHVFAWQVGSKAESEADFFYPISIVEKDDILNVCKALGINGVLSIASDLAMITVDYVAHNLGLVGNSLDCSRKATNKFFMREALERHELPIPKYQLVSTASDINYEELCLPCIVKPIDRSGSRGITLVSNISDLNDAILNSQKESFVEEVLVEEYITGREYSVESISYQGKHSVLQVTEKFTSGSPNFIERAHLAPAKISKDTELNIIKIISCSLTSLGIINGASHAEIKITETNDIKIIEIGARMGGDFIGSHLVKNNTGYNYVNAVIDVAMGEKIELPNTQSMVIAECYSLVVYFFNELQYKHLNEIVNIPGVDVIHTNRNKEYNGIVTSSAERLGYSHINIKKDQLKIVLYELGLLNDKF